MEDRWEQGEAGGKETSQEAAVVIRARNDEVPLPRSKQQGWSKRDRCGSHFERRSLWLLHVGCKGQERGKRDSGAFEPGEVMSERENGLGAV